MPKIKKAAKDKVAKSVKQKAVEAAKAVPCQGQLLTLLNEEEQDITWKSLIFKIPRGLLAWGVRACTNTLATPDNLRRWGHMVDARCAIEGCNLPCTLGHLLNNCSHMLDRYKFRHDSVLNHIVVRILENKPALMEMYADLDGWRTGGGTVPPSLVVTGQIPDLVLVDRSTTPTKVVLLELTVPWDSSKSFEDARIRKEERYRRLTIDLKDAGYQAVNLPLEVGSRGVISSRNMGVLTSLVSMVGIRNLKQFRRTLGKISLLGSYRVWLAWRSQEWAPGAIIQP